MVKFGAGRGGIMIFPRAVTVARTHQLRFRTGLWTVECGNVVRLCDTPETLPCPAQRRLGWAGHYCRFRSGADGGGGGGTLVDTGDALRGACFDFRLGIRVYSWNRNR